MCKEQYEESHRVWNKNGWKSISYNLSITDNHKNKNYITMWFYLCNLDCQNFKSLKLPATNRYEVQGTLILWSWKYNLDNWLEE